MQFDGVYFQKHMENIVAGISDAQRETLLTPNQRYRIYN